MDFLLDASDDGVAVDDHREVGDERLGGQHHLELGVPRDVGVVGDHGANVGFGESGTRAEEKKKNIERFYFSKNSC